MAWELRARDAHRRRRVLSHRLGGCFDIRVVASELGEPYPEDAVTGQQFRAFDGLLENGNLLPQCKVLKGGSSAAKKECPEEKEDGLEDAHGLEFQHSANGQSYWNGLARANGWGRAFPKWPENAQIRIFPPLRNRLR